MMDPVHTGGLHDFLLTALEVRDQGSEPMGRLLTGLALVPGQVSLTALQAAAPSNVQREGCLPAERG